MTGDWILEEKGEDSYDLIRGRKRILVDASMTQIKKYMRRFMEKGQCVVLVEQDGYRRNVSRWFHSRVFKRP